MKWYWKVNVELELENKVDQFIKTSVSSKVVSNGKRRTGILQKRCPVLQKHTPFNFTNLPSIYLDKLF